MYDLFVCIIQILFEYCSTDIVPEVRFVIRISVGVAAVTFVISRYYIGTVINRSIRIDVVFRFSFCKNSRCCSNPLLFLNPRWHMLQLTYCPLFWFWFCWFEVINSLGLSTMTTSCLNKSFYFSFSWTFNVRRIKRNIFWDFSLSVRKKRPLAMPLHGKFCYVNICNINVNKIVRVSV